RAATAAERVRLRRRERPHGPAPEPAQGRAPRRVQEAAGIFARAARGATRRGGDAGGRRNAGGVRAAPAPENVSARGERRKKMPAVSVIIPTRERPHLLRRAVESARAAGENVEVVVVDDASTDETANVCAAIPGI